MPQRSVIPSTFSRTSISLPKTDKTTTCSLSTFTIVLWMPYLALLHCPAHSNCLRYQQVRTAKHGRSPGLRSSTDFLCTFTQFAAHQQRNESLRKQIWSACKVSGRVHNLLELPKPHAKEIGGHETFDGEGSDSEIPDSAQRVYVGFADRSHDQFKQS